MAARLLMAAPLAAAPAAVGIAEEEEEYMHVLACEVANNHVCEVAPAWGCL
jgi:hypothetical protein